MAYWLYCNECQQWSKSATPLSDDKTCSYCNRNFTSRVKKNYDLILAASDEPLPEAEVETEVTADVPVAEETVAVTEDSQATAVDDTATAAEAVQTEIVEEEAEENKDPDPEPVKTEIVFRAKAEKPAASSLQKTEKVTEVTEETPIEEAMPEEEVAAALEAPEEPMADESTESVDESTESITADETTESEIVDEDEQPAPEATADDEVEAPVAVKPNPERKGYSYRRR